MTLYPQLNPEQPKVSADPRVFRLSHINTIQQELEREIQKYRKCQSRYASAFKYVDRTGSSLGVITVAMGGAGIGLLASGVAAPVGLVLEGVAFGGGALSLICNFVSIKLMKKLKKHEEICILAHSKLSGIQRLISKALEDNAISDVEFNLIKDVYDAYKSEKNQIHQKTHSVQVDEKSVEEIKKKFTEMGRLLERKSLSEKLNLSPANGDSK